jgi:LysM repeat protein
VNSLADLRQYVPTKHLLYSLLAVVAMLIVAVGDFLFLRSSILPQVRARRELASQLASARRELTEARGTQEDAPQRLTRQLATAQARLDEAANAFLSESQAAQALSRLYDYADASGVKIITLQTQQDHEGKEGKVDVRRFGLRVEGTVPRLVDFVSRMEWTALESFKLANVQIAEGETLHELTLDITLYTSPYSTAEGAAELPVSTRPVIPVDRTQPSPGLAQLDEALAAAWDAGQWQLAVELIDQIGAIDPDYDDVTQKRYAAYVNYGHALLQQGDTGGAAVQFRAALETKPDGEEAAKGLQQAAATPVPTRTGEEELARRLHDPWAAEDWEEVISLIEQIRAINPDYDDMTEKLYAALVNYGHRLIAEGNLEAAKERFSRALNIKPDGAEAMAGLRQLAGEALPLPSPTSPPAPPQPQYVTYIVRGGDTLYSIARRYGTSVEAVMAANGLGDYNIYAGQQLRIPVQ